MAYVVCMLNKQCWLLTTLDHADNYLSLAQFQQKGDVYTKQSK